MTRFPFVVVVEVCDQVAGGRRDRVVPGDGPAGAVVLRQVVGPNAPKRSMECHVELRTVVAHDHDLPVLIVLPEH